MAQDAKVRLAAAHDFDPVEAGLESTRRPGGRARMLYETFAARGERSAKALSRQIATRPFISLLIAVGVGLCASRLFLSR